MKGLDREIWMTILLMIVISIVAYSYAYHNPSEYIEIKKTEVQQYNHTINNLTKQLNNITLTHKKLCSELCGIGIEEFCKKSASIDIKIIECGFNCINWRGYLLCQNITCNSGITYSIYKCCETENITLGHP